MSDDTRRKTILATLSDLVSSFLYYDRKEDDELPRGAIDEAVRCGEITADEIVHAFDIELRKGLK